MFVGCTGAEASGASCMYLLSPIVQSTELLLGNIPSEIGIGLRILGIPGHVGGVLVSSMADEKTRRMSVLEGNLASSVVINGNCACHEK